MTIETTLELYDFGVPVHVTQPPANQVEVIRPELPPPGCTHQKDNGTTGSSAAAQGNTAQAEPPACPQGWSSSDGGASGHRDSVPWAGRSLDPQPSTQPLTIGPISVQALVPGSPGPA